ncbi:hypothetical protein predicted by Glimmer/Critica [Sorangium cellulosum So ce56]|uniref:PAC domain-containing protein n=1 Tax=Sorangium cellulosum (strain So ce56) TaxID=448385 RepID=A9GMZ8_SORC5|nr:hypothetical protein predicted by Glimmer/Critica [Sorangium cellulosum So ce56]
MPDEPVRVLLAEEEGRDLAGTIEGQETAEATHFHLSGRPPSASSSVARTERPSAPTVGLPGAYDIKLWIDTLFFPVTDEAGAKYVIEAHRDVTRQQLDLLERQAAEGENRRLQEEMQRTREAALRALSTPLIPSD